MTVPETPEITFLKAAGEERRANACIGEGNGGFGRTVVLGFHGGWIRRKEGGFSLMGKARTRTTASDGWG